MYSMNLSELAFKFLKTLVIFTQSGSLSETGQIFISCDPFFGPALIKIHF